ncbi:MAG: thiamine-phosphate kinase [Actinomycetota bacterium]
MDLSELGEFGFIERMRSWLPEGSAVAGIGDDAAVMRTGDGGLIVAATDALVEGTHFRLDWSDPSDVGFKSVSVNVSDVAAMGACPRWLLLALGAPPETSEEVLRGLYAGIDDACREYRTELVGGDTVRAPVLTLAVTVIGSVDGEPVRRSGAEVGDVLAVTGPLGRAAVGVNLLLSQDAKAVIPEDAIACMDAHRRPRARLDAGTHLRSIGAHAAIDISDGLASDARRLAGASGVGVEIDLDLVPVAPEARRVAEARSWDIEPLVLGGGEDFELLVALPLEALDKADWIEIGRVVPEGLTLVRNGERAELPDAGYDNFAR